MKQLLEKSLIRRLGFGAGIIAVAAGLIVGGLWLYRTMKYPSGEVLHAIPSSAVLVAEGVGLYPFAEEISVNPLWQQATESSGEDEPFMAILTQLKEKFGDEEPMLRNLLYEQPFAMALIPKKEFGPALLYVIRLQDGIPVSQVHSSIKKVFPDYTSKRLLEISYHEIAIPGSRVVYVMAKDGLLLFSADREVFELSYYTLESGNHLGNDQVFLTARKQLSKSQNSVPNVLVSHEALYGWFRRFLTPELREVVSVITEVGSWSALEVSSLNESIHLQGFTDILLQRPAYFESMLLGGKQLFDPGSLLPFNTLFYDQLAVSGYAEFYQHCIQGYHFDVRGDSLSFPIQKSLKDSLSMVLGEAELRNVIIAMVSGGDSAQSGEMLLVMEAARIETARRGLGLFSDTTQRLVYQGFSVEKLSYPGMLPAMFGKRFESFRESWYTIHENRIIMAPGKEVLMSAINAMSLGKTLQSVAGYTDGISKIKGALSRRYYFNTSPASPFLRAHILPEMSTQFAAFFPMMPGQIILGLTREDGVILTDVVALPQTGHASEALFKEVVLDDVPITDPVLLKDHRTGTMRVMIADRSGNLYSLSRSKGPEWKMTPRETPASALRVIDMYQNGRNQCLFLSKSMLHIVQADGQYVQGYPVMLPSEFHSHLSVFDYESNGNYRVIYRDVQGRLMNIDLGGKTVAGWTQPVVSPSGRDVTWHLINGLDFLVFADESGQVTVLDRRGKVRFTVPEVRISERSSIGIGMYLGQPALTFLDTEGSVVQVDVQGIPHRHELIQLSPKSRLIIIELPGKGNGFLVVEPSRISLYEKTLKLEHTREGEEMIWQHLNPVRGSEKYWAIGTNQQGVPVLLEAKTAKISLIGEVSVDHCLAWYHSEAAEEEVVFIKGVLVRIGPLTMPGRE